MLEILQFYVSGFWIWLGITVAAIFLLKVSIELIVLFISIFRPEVAVSYYRYQEEIEAKRVKKRETENE